MLRKVMLFRVKFVLAFAAFVLLVFGGCHRFCVFGANETDAVAAIAAVEEKIIPCYNAVLEAESFDVNVSSFLVRLNVAGGFLADAEMCYRNGNFSGAVYFAGLASESLSGLESEAVELTNSAEVERSQKLSWTIVGSAFGVFLVVFFGFLGWGYVRNHYVRKVLKMKPEVSGVDEHR